jgi:UDP-N-acetyl-D-glucosamine dehydrogenase
MPEYVITKVIKALNENGKTVKGAKILICGLAYKANVDDDRESPSYRLMEKLEKLGAIVSYNDPFIPEIRPSREFARYAGRKSIAISGEYDLLLVATAHDEYRKTDFGKLGIPIVDTRNIVPGHYKTLYQA